MEHIRLREWLAENHLRLKDLSRCVNCSNLSYYTSNKVPFKVDYYLKWQKAYRWSDKELFEIMLDRDIDQSVFGTPKALPANVDQIIQAVDLLKAVLAS